VAARVERDEHIIVEQLTAALQHLSTTRSRIYSLLRKHQQGELDLHGASLSDAFCVSNHVENMVNAIQIAMQVIELQSREALEAGQSGSDTDRIFKQVERNRGGYPPPGSQSP